MDQRDSLFATGSLGVNNAKANLTSKTKLHREHLKDTRKWSELWCRARENHRQIVCPAETLIFSGFDAILRFFPGNIFC
jgi:hypothetical protein